MDFRVFLSCLRVGGKTRVRPKVELKGGGAKIDEERNNAVRAETRPDTHTKEEAMVETYFPTE